MNSASSRRTIYIFNCVLSYYMYFPMDINTKNKKPNKLPLKVTLNDMQKGI